MMVIPEHLLELCIDEKNPCIRQNAIEIAALKLQMQERDREDVKVRERLISTANALDERLDMIDKMIAVTDTRTATLLWVFGIFSASIIGMIALLVVHTFGGLG